MGTSLIAVGSDIPVTALPTPPAATITQAAPESATSEIITAQEAPVSSGVDQREANLESVPVSTGNPAAVVSEHHPDTPSEDFKEIVADESSEEQSESEKPVRIRSMTNSEEISPGRTRDSDFGLSDEQVQALVRNCQENVAGLDSDLRPSGEPSSTRSSRHCLTTSQELSPSRILDSDFGISDEQLEELIRSSQSQMSALKQETAGADSDLGEEGHSSHENEVVKRPLHKLLTSSSTTATSDDCQDSDFGLSSEQLEGYGMPSTRVRALTGNVADQNIDASDDDFGLSDKQLEKLNSFHA